MVLPFTRVLNDYRLELETLSNGGIEIADLADPDARIPHDLAWKLIQVSIEKTGDLELGLHAGQRIEANDWGPMAYAAANCTDIRKAIQYCNRYMKLLDDFGDSALIEQDDRATWQFRYAIARPLPAVSDFLVTSGFMAIARFTGRIKPPIEVHLVHPEPSYTSEYLRVFRAPVRYNCEYNAIVVARSVLDQPVFCANPDIFAAFDLKTRRLMEELSSSTTAGARVQRLVVNQLGRGEIGMKEIARQLHMSVATLRRRLGDEGTTHNQLVEQVRHEFALRYIVNPQIPVAEIAAMLGFSSASAFGKAFKRWEGLSPIEYRVRKRQKS
jgi:AraC-like DNA-binding protein